jgi:gag-polypeptide of LTR copia-type
MSPALNMTTPTTSASASQDNGTKYYTSKYGRIPIFDGDNYATFSTECRTALTVAGAWDIVDGSEVRPVDPAAGTSWDERKLKAIQLINSSVVQALKSRIIPGVRAADPKAMWTELAKEDRMTSTVHQYTLFSDFHKATWDPSAETIRSFQARLQDMRTQLEGTERSISEKEMLWRVITSIPDEGNWIQARQFCLEDNKDLAGTITTLQSYKKPILPSTTPTAPAVAAAATTPDQRGNRGGRRGRGRGRGQGRGSGRNKGKGGRRVDKDDKEDKCFFCRKPGHRQVDCFKYKKARDALEESPKEERVNLVSYFDQSDPDSSLYTEEYTEEYVLVTNSNGNWAVDSAATRHFSGFIQDF